MDKIFKYAGVSFYGSFIVAAIISYVVPSLLSEMSLSAHMALEMLLKTLFIVFLFHMLVFSFCFAFKCKKTLNKILLVVFSLLFPFVSGYVLFFFKNRLHTSDSSKAIEN